MVPTGRPKAALAVWSPARRCFVQRRLEQELARALAVARFQATPTLIPRGRRVTLLELVEALEDALGDSPRTAGAADRLFLFRVVWHRTHNEIPQTPPNLGPSGPICNKNPSPKHVHVWLNSFAVPSFESKNSVLGQRLGKKRNLRTNAKTGTKATGEGKLWSEVIVT